MLTEWKTGAARLSHITNTRMRKEQRTYLTYCVKAVGQQSDLHEGVEARIPLHDKQFWPDDNVKDKPVIPQRAAVGRGKKQLPVAAEGDVDESREAEQIGQVYGPECFCARIICTVTIESASRSSEPHRRYHFGNIRVSRMALVYTRYRAWFI